MEVNSKQIIYNLLNLKQLVFEVTDSCNLNCKYCGYSDLYVGYDERKNNYLNVAVSKTVIDYLVDIWRENLLEDMVKPLTIGFYGGEPLLNMKFIKDTVSYVETLKDTRKIFRYSMTTNAVLLDKYWDYLVEKDFHLLISLDGDEFSHSYRVDHAGYNSFYKVYDNVCKLQSLFPEYFEKNVAFNTVLHDRNDVDSVHDFMVSNFDKVSSFSSLNTSGIKTDKRGVFEKMYKNVVDSMGKSENLDLLEKKMFIKSPMIYRLSSFLFQYTGNVYYDYNSLFFSKDDFYQYPTGTCTPFLKKMYVTVNGKILQCEKIDHDFYLGIVKDGSVLIDFDHVAERHNYFVHKFIDDCSSCAIRGNCIQCVYQNDDIRDENVSCKFYRDVQKNEHMCKEYLFYLKANPDLYQRILTEVIMEN